ncbi:Ribosomal RNA small subunit methyltransferase NEP1 [Sesamum angolense]|uniref:Ribosomal RNA small subunit methyltransferase NEP1 n=1 Tax=Sesamum angolense TaxID=2727404 RepID=A0AAE2C091_9LAMI|nr:Ribosomal RNA small subunit methyltransferase NEP1 [Sesamum angolense]
MEDLRACSSRLFVGKKRKIEETSHEEEVREHLTRRVPVESHNQKPMISFILHNAAIRKSFIKKKWVVANGIDDEEALLRQNKNPNDYMSQIAHVALKAILDSPLNKYGLIGAIYVKIADGALFEVKPHVRIPRTLPRFSGLMCISRNSRKLVDLLDYVNAAREDVHLVFMVGISTSEEINQQQLDDTISAELETLIVCVIEGGDLICNQRVVDTTE